MGYYTRYKVKIDLSRRTGMSYCEQQQFVDFILNDRSITGGCSLKEIEYESCKWYDHTEDMCRFSLKYPNVLFELSGEGEESGDIWRKYYLNGKYQECHAIITFPEFDESKMVNL